MSSYDARLGLPHHPRLPLPVQVETTNSNISVTLGDTPIADWVIDRVSITREKRGFRIIADEEDLLIEVTEADRFALDVGIAQPQPAQSITGPAG